MTTKKSLYLIRKNDKGDENIPIIEIVQVTKISQSKTYIPKSIRDILKVEDGEKIAWCLDKNGNIVVMKSTKIDPFKTEGIDFF